MLQVKVFSTATFDGDTARLEAAVNEWLRADDPIIRHMAPATQGSHLVLTFLYEEGFAAQEVATAEASAEVPDVFGRELDGSDLDPSETDVPPLPDAELPY